MELLQFITENRNTGFECLRDREPPKSGRFAAFCPRGSRKDTGRSMKPLEPPDSLHLQAAQGWCRASLVLGRQRGTRKDYTPAPRSPSVMEVRWQIYANLEKMGIGSGHRQCHRKNGARHGRAGWIYRPRSLTEVNRQEEAYET